MGIFYVKLIFGVFWQKLGFVFKIILLYVVCWPTFVLVGVNLLKVGSEVWVPAQATDTEIYLKIFSQKQILGSKGALKWLILTKSQNIFLRALYFFVL